MKKMFGLVKKQAYSIGIDVNNDNLKLIQLGGLGKVVNLVSGVSENRPMDIEPGSSNWQRWAVDTIRQLVSNRNFQGKNVVASIPSSEVFIDHMKSPKPKDNNIENAVFAKIKQKLPFQPIQENILLKCIPTEQDNLIVMVTEKEMVNRHLAIYEKAGLSIKSMCIWPNALVNCYTKFFGRRQTDLNSIVMLICMEQNNTNVLICRHKNLMFARSISIGDRQINENGGATRLVLELTSFRRQFDLMYRDLKIERLIFFSNKVNDRDFCATVAKQLEMPAQLGDCLAAVDMPIYQNSLNASNKRGKKLLGDIIDRRDCRLNWSVAFGLSLS